MKDGSKDIDGGPIDADQALERPQRYVFSDYCLDPVDRSLTRNGAPITVQAQVFDLLHYLIQRPGAVISKDQLLSEVWNNRFLGDAVIAQAVKKARLALGDDGRTQAMIRTVHGRGVSFLPDVIQQFDGEPSGQASELLQPSRAGAWMPGRVWPWLVLVGPLLLLAAWVFLGESRSGSAADSDAASATESSSAQALAQETLVVFPFEIAGEQGDGESGLGWLQLGLAQTTALLLDQSGGLQVRTPQDLLELPEGAPAEQMRVLGVSRRLEARVLSEQGQFKLTWRLFQTSNSENNGSRSDPNQIVQGEIVSSDSSQLARRLADAVLNALAGQPDAPLPSQPVLQDPLASELYARAIQAIYSDRRAQARALLQAALTREPNSIPLRVAYAQASFDPSDVKASIDSAMPLLDELINADPVAAASLIKTVGIALWNSGEIDASASLLQRGLDLLEGLNAIDGNAEGRSSEGRAAEGLRAALLNALAMSLNSQSRFDAAWDSASRAELIFRQLDDPYHLSLVLTNMAYFAEDRGRILQAGELHQQALAIRQRYQFPQLIAASQYGLARIERRSGRFDEAEDLLDQSLATVTELGLAFDRFDNLEELAEVHMRQGRFDLARSRIEQAAELAADNDDALGQAWAKQVSGRLALREQRIDAASLDTIESARDALASMGEDQDVLTASLELVEAHLQLRDQYRYEDRQEDSHHLEVSDEIDSILGALTASEMVANPVLKLQYDAMRAEVMAQEMAQSGEIEPALAAYRELVRQARQIGVVDLEAEYAIRLGQLALLVNDSDSARSMLAIASRWSSEYYRTTALAESIAANQ